MTQMHEEGRCRACGRPADEEPFRHTSTVADGLLGAGRRNGQPAKRPWNWALTGREGTPLRVWQVGDLVVDEETRRVVRSGAPIDLTGVEFRLLCELARGADTVVTKARLASAVWEAAPGSDNLLQRHVTNLRRKLEAHGSRLVHTVRGHGYLLRG